MGFAADLATRGHKRCKAVLAAGIVQIQHDFLPYPAQGKHEPFSS
jgi:hypothetical protein